MTKESGRVPSAPGSTRFAPEAPTGLRPSGDDPSRSVRSLYEELLFAVSCKYPGESRHETALRYIRQRDEGHVSQSGGKSESRMTYRETTTKCTID